MVSVPEPEWAPPRCAHGRIILGCPEEVCPEQDAYLAEYAARYEAYVAEQQQQARLLIQSLMGVPDDRQP